MNIKSECYFGYIPESLKLELPTLYKTPYCTSEYVQLFYDEPILNCFAIYNKDRLIHLILFTIDQHQRIVNVLNRLFEFNIRDVDIFSNYIFHAELQVDRIQVNHLLTPILPKQFLPYLCKPFSEDFLLKLPVSNSAYISEMSANMRRHTKNYISRIERTFGSYKFFVFEKKNISENVINRIIEMNHSRMIAKNIVSGIDSSYAKKIKSFVQDYGYISVLELKGEIVSGLISYSVENNYFVEALSSDPKFDAYNVGHTCLYLTIKNCIDRNGNEFHLLWGNSPYKQRFLADRKQLYSLTVFRTNLLKQKYKLINDILRVFSFKFLLKLLKAKIKRILNVIPKILDFKKIT